VFATGSLYVLPQLGANNPPLHDIRVEVDKVEITNINPPELEDAVECYVRLAIRTYALPELVKALKKIRIKSPHLKFSPSLTSGLPNNPAIEQNKLLVWLDVNVTKVTGP